MSRLGCAALLLTSASLSGCVVIGGRFYPAWVGSVSNVTCGLAVEQVEQPASRVEVIAMDEAGSPIPGAVVTVTDASDPVSTPRVGVTGREGQITLLMPQSGALVLIELTGLMPVRARIAATKSQKCIVRAYLRVDPRKTISIE